MKALIIVSAIAIGLVDLFMIGFVCLAIGALIEYIKERLEEKRRKHGK